MRTARVAVLVLTCLGVVGCHTDMWRQNKVRPQQQSEFFADGVADRLPVAGTVARGHLKLDKEFFAGRSDGKLVRELPTRVYQEFAANKKALEQYGTVQRAILKRGEERFNAICSNCHGMAGDGKGMIALRGFSINRPPGNFHTERLRQMPVGHFFDVITNGFGTMFAQAPRVEVADRWAIAAYIRALQLSKYISTDALKAEDIEKVEAAAKSQKGAP